MLRAACTILLILVSPVLAQARASPAQRLLDGAYAQIGVTLRYDPSYRIIAFPGGDVPLDRGVCSDVVIRAYRHAGVDLQRLVNEDMRRNFDQYPRLWGLSRPDPNIDHRRVPNLARFFARRGAALPITAAAQDYRAGDIVTWRLPGGEAHIGLVANRIENGRPLVVHNIGERTRLDDVLFAFAITGHDRYAAGAPGR